MSLDPGDEHVIDCAMNAQAPVVTLNTRDFRLAAQTLGIVIPGKPVPAACQPTPLRAIGGGYGIPVLVRSSREDVSGI
jgi:hypothetical protein